MQVRNNRGELTGEINTGVTAGGDRFTTNTLYDSFGNPLVQNVSIRRSDGTVETTNIIGTKILP